MGAVSLRNSEQVAEIQYVQGTVKRRESLWAVDREEVGWSVCWEHLGGGPD